MLALLICVMVSPMATTTVLPLEPAELVIVTARVMMSIVIVPHGNFLGELFPLEVLSSPMIVQI